MGLRPTQGDEKHLLSSNRPPGKRRPPLCHTGRTWAVGPWGPPKEMKNSFCRVTALNGSVALPFVIPRACDFFDLFAFFALDQMFFSPLQKGVILSEAPRRSIA